MGGACFPLKTHSNAVRGIRGFHLHQAQGTRHKAQGTRHKEPETRNRMTSIIIPHRNRSALIAETLRSLEEQTRQDWEAIVVDHDSEPDEAERLSHLVASLPRVRLLTRQGGPPGPSASRNLGLREARGEFVIFLDSDDLLAPWCLEERSEFLRNHPEADFVVFQALLFESVPGDLPDLWGNLDSTDDLQLFLTTHAPWCVSGPIWRVEAIRKLGGFDPEVFYGDDSELHTRALLSDFNYAKANPASLPDHFVRRSSEIPRVTSGQASREVEASRLKRLEATSTFLARSKDTRHHAKLFEAKYFEEGERILFHAAEPTEALRLLLDSWDCLQPMPQYRRQLVRLYLGTAAALRDHCYLGLRVLRRMAMKVLPRHYFPV